MLADQNLQERLLGVQTRIEPYKRTYLNKRYVQCKNKMTSIRLPIYFRPNIELIQ